MIQPVAVPEVLSTDLPVGVFLLLLGEQPRDRLGAPELAAVRGGGVREHRLLLHRHCRGEHGAVAFGLRESVADAQKQGDRARHHDAGRYREYAFQPAPDAAVYGFANRGSVR